MPLNNKANLSEQIADHITDKIIRLEIRPGERIMETRIADELKVSRSPIREALHILEKNRLVELIPRRGARVTELPETFIVQLCDILTALFRLMARQCVENGTAENLEAIDAAAKRSRDCVAREDVYGYYTALFDFAVATLKATHNPLLEQLIQELLPNVQRLIYASFSIQKETLEKNMAAVMTGNQYLQERNAKMAEMEVSHYIEKAKAFALENNIFPTS
jgi:DNA-binding GntR family transcriptional regulator